TDVYALGAILYELLTGRPPFTGASAITILTSIVNLEPVPPARLRAHLPRDLETICLKCLNKQPSHRYASALALAEDLHRFLAGEPIRARRARVWERVCKWGRRRPTAAAAVAAALLLAVSAGALGLWYWDAHYRVKSEYYAHFANRWGVWEGVEPLS